jgi:hypothetical protein
MAHDDDIQTVVDFLRHELQPGEQNNLKKTLKMGTYLLDNFFGGDPIAFGSRSRDSPSLRRLAEHPDVDALGISRKSLENAIKIAIQQERFLGWTQRGVTAEILELPVVKRIELARCRSPAAEVALAVEAVQQGLSRPAIVERVRELNAATTGKGRPQSEFVRSWRNLDEASTVATTLDVAEISDEELELARKVTYWVNTQKRRRINSFSVESACQNTFPTRRLTSTPLTICWLEIPIRPRVNSLSIAPRR